MTLSDLEHTKLAIWGLGAEGQESYRYLRKRYPAKPLILINEVVPDDMDNYDNVSFILEQELPQNMAHIDLVIKSPGISLYHPLVILLKQNKIRLTSATNIWFAGNSPSEATIIAVTGSNGKSTTCALLYHIFSGLNLAVALGGNIGTPLLSLPKEVKYYIVELSSYQTSDLEYSPDIALLLNLFPEHIQWHHSHAQYFEDKCRLIKAGAETVILNRTDPLTQKIITDVPKNTIWFNDPRALHLKDDCIFFGETLIGRGKDITLLGRHNRENICAALTICQALGFDVTDCFRLAASYKGLQHRLENLGTFNGITYINDSISTTPEATIAALECFEGRDITLLLGGQNRQQDHAKLIEYIIEHPKIKTILAYETGQTIQNYLREIKAQPTIIESENLINSVMLAKKITPIGGIILLSPAAPSYDAFKNFKQRGDFFKKYSGT